MATVVDELVVRLNLDSEGWKKAQKDVENAFDRLRQEAVRTTRLLEDQTEKTSKSIERVHKSTLEYFAALVSGTAVAAFLKQIAQVDSSLMRTSRNVGLSVEHLSAFHIAMTTTGGKAEDFDQALKEINKGFFELYEQGKNVLDSKMFQAFKRYGVELPKKWDDAETRIRAYGKVINGIINDPKIPEASKLSWAKSQYGISEAMYNMFRRYKDVNNLYKEIGETGTVVTKKQAEAAERLNEIYVKLIENFNKLGAVILEHFERPLRGVMWIVDIVVIGLKMISTVIGVITSAIFGIAEFLATQLALKVIQFFEDWSHIVLTINRGIKMMIQYLKDFLALLNDNKLKRFFDKPLQPKGHVEPDGTWLPDATPQSNTGGGGGFNDGVYRPGGGGDGSTGRSGRSGGSGDDTAQSPGGGGGGGQQGSDGQSQGATSGGGSDGQSPGASAPPPRPAPSGSMAGTVGPEQGQFFHGGDQTGRQDLTGGAQGGAMGGTVGSEMGGASMAQPAGGGSSGGDGGSSQKAGADTSQGKNWLDMNNAEYEQRAGTRSFSEEGLALIRKRESFRSQSYPDQGGYAIGYGSPSYKGEPSIDKPEAERRMQGVVRGIDKWINENVKVPLTQGDRAALTSFAYNLGTGRPGGEKGLGRVLNSINSGNWAELKERMGTFSKVGGKWNEGMHGRRLDEISHMGNGPGPQWGGGMQQPDNKTNAVEADISRDIKKRFPRMRNEQCVALAKAYVGSGGSVTDWRRGEGAMGGGLKPGTPVATFMGKNYQQSDRYAGGGPGTPGIHRDHAGVFLGYELDSKGHITGMRIAEQYKGSHGVHEKTYHSRGVGSRNASNYYSINDSGGRPLGGQRNPMSRQGPPTGHPESHNYGAKGALEESKAHDTVHSFLAHRHHTGAQLVNHASNSVGNYNNNTQTSHVHGDIHVGTASAHTGGSGKDLSNTLKHSSGGMANNHGMA